MDVLCQVEYKLQLQLRISSMLFVVRSEACFPVDK